MSTKLQITQQETEDRQMRLSITVPEDRVEKALRAEVRRLGKRINVPGFRPGKAPFHIVMQRYGRDTFLEGIIDDLGQEVLAEALEETNIEPYARPVLEEVESTPLTYHITIPLEPEVDPGDYRQLRISMKEVDEEEVQAKVQEQLASLQNENKTWQPVERPIEYGDLVTMAIKITVNDEVVLENDDWDFIPDENDYTLAPDFDATFIGMQIGESKTFSTDIPEDANSPWAGKSATFEVEIKGIKAMVAPELNDEFVQDVSQFETLAELEAAITEMVREELEDSLEHEHSHRVMDALREQATLTYPPVLLENQIDMLEQQREDYYKTLGIENTETLLRLLNKTPEAYREELTEPAREELEIELLLDAIAEREQFEISDYELHQFLADALLPDTETLEELSAELDNNPVYRAHIETLVKRHRARTLLLAIAKGEDVPAPGEHPVLSAPEPAETDDENEEDATNNAEAETSSQLETEEQAPPEASDTD